MGSLPSLNGKEDEKDQGAIPRAINHIFSQLSLNGDDIGLCTIF